MQDLLIITGPTAIGKSALAIRIARKFRLEIISGDSMQVYEDMNIGTAKPSLGELNEVRHHMIDIRKPNQEFSAPEFKELAEIKIEEIASRGALPAIVGGTGLYITALIDQYNFQHIEEDPEVRDKLYKEIEQEQNGADKLYKELLDVDPEAASKIHPHNHKRLVRALEVWRTCGERFSALKSRDRTTLDKQKFNLVWVGLNEDREILYDRINKRVDEMIENGLIDEVQTLFGKYTHLSKTALQGIGYKEIISYLNKKISLEEAIYRIKQSSRKYAKRQLTWFKRRDEIIWIEHHEDYLVEQLILSKFGNKYYIGRG